MKAVFAKSRFQFDIREMDIPEPADDEVLVKVKACGVCGTDLHFARDWTEDWAPLGHEISAEVVEIGQDVTDFKPGDKVIIEDVQARGFSEDCKNDEYFRCQDNYDLKGQPGMAEYMAVNQHLLTRFDGIDFVYASLVEPLAVAINTVLHAEIPLGGNVVVYGPGPIGLMCVRLAYLRGAAKVALIGSSRQSIRGTARMKVGEEFGADPLIYAQDEDPVEAVRAAFPQGADRVIVVSPPKTLPFAVPMIKFGGLISFIGIDLGGESKVELDVNELIFNKITLRPTFAEPAIKFPVSIRLLQEGLVDAKKLVTHTFTFPETEKIFRMSNDSQEGIIKAVLLPGG